MLSALRLSYVFNASPQEIINALYNAHVDAVAYDDDGPLYDPAAALAVLPDIFSVRPQDHAAASAPDGDVGVKMVDENYDV